MSDTPAITAARIEVARRRGEMLGTMHTLQARLQPKTLANDAWTKAKTKGADMAEDAVDAVKARPVAAGGVAAVLGLFLARQPIKDAAVKLYDALTSDNAAKGERLTLKQQSGAAEPRRPTDGGSTNG